MIGNISRAFVLGAVLASTYTITSRADENNLVGSYKLLGGTTKVVDTGEISDFFGKQPSGYIVYTSDGRMLVLIVADKNDRPAIENFVKLTDRQRAGLIQWLHMVARMNLTAIQSSIILTFHGIRHG